MEPYRIDFAMMRGHELILDREQPITREELDTMELQMLRSNSIPFLLPVEWIDIDGNVTFRYAIEGKRMLSHQLQLVELTMQDMYACLLAIADALDACKSYLLRPECCLLKDSCLFIGERWDEVYLLYVPVQTPLDEFKQAVDGASEFTSLVMRLSSHVKELDGAGLQTVLKQLLDSRGGIRPALRKVLLELLEGHSRHQGSQHQLEMHSMRAQHGQHGQYGHHGQQGLQGQQGQYGQYEQFGQSKMEAMHEQFGQTGLPIAEVEQMYRGQPHLQLRQEHQQGEARQEQGAWFRKSRSNTPVQPFSQFQASQLGEGLQVSEDEERSSRRQEQFHSQTEGPAGDETFKGTAGAGLPDTDGSELPVHQERSKWVVSAAAAIAAALVWRYGYMNQPTDNRLIICLGATVIITAAAYMAGWRGRRRVNAAGGSVPDNSRYDSRSLNPPPQWSLESRLLERRAASMPVKTERRARPMPEPSVSHASANADVASSRYPETVHPRSAMIYNALDEPESTAAASEATVWIGRDTNRPAIGRDGVEEKVEWQLERMSKGTVEPLMLPLSGFSTFLIGRTGGKVHYADEHPGISRVHLEIGSSEEGYSVKDLGSRNGTTLNGSPMIAYKIYKLQSEDALQLAGNDGPVYTIRQVKHAAGA